jgi:hypothetical protein
MDSATLQSNKDLLHAFYSKHDVSKIEKIEEILKAWPLLELQDALKKKYGEVPNLIFVVQSKQPVGDDDVMISSEDSDLVVVSANLKKPKKLKKSKKKDKKDKKDKVIDDKTAKTRKIKKAAVADPVENAKPNAALPANWGRAAPVTKASGQKWWSQAMSDIDMVKRRLTQQAMNFVDEAVRRHLDEKARRAAEVREAKAMGLEKRDIAVTVLDDEDEAPAAPVSDQFDAPAMSRSDFDIDSYTGPGRAESDDELDGEDRGVKVGGKFNVHAGKDRDVSSRISSRKPSEKEQMQKVLSEHFASLEQMDADGPPAGGDFASFESFDARKAQMKAHGLPEAEMDSDSSDSADSSDEEKTKVQQVIDFWGKPPEELLSRTDLEESADGSRAFVAHFVRFAMGAWSEILAQGRKIEGNGLTEYVTATFNSAMVLEKTKEALAPLLVNLQRNTVNSGLLQKIDNIATLATQREYARVMEEYVGVTMGKKLWFQSHMQTMMQQNHGGSVAKILKQSAFIDFDVDTTVNAYMLALKRVIQFLQWLRPAIKPSHGVGI